MKFYLITMLFINNSMKLFTVLFIICHFLFFTPTASALKTNGISAIVTDECNTLDGHAPSGAVIENGNVYEKPDTDAAVISVLLKGESVNILHAENEWIGVMLTDKRMGWVHKSLFAPSALTEDEPDSEETEAPVRLTESRKTESRITESNTRLRVKVRTGRVRENPSFDSGVDFGLKQGDVVAMIGSADDWYLIKDSDGKQGWAHKSLFQTVDETQIISVTDEAQRIPDDVSPKILSGVRFEATPEGEERVVFSLNGFNPPQSFALPEDIPKVVCDFHNTDMAKGISRLIKAGGNYIDQIRIGVHRGSEKKIRVVLDLKPNKDYDVEQLFFKKDNTYVLIFK